MNQAIEEHSPVKMFVGFSGGRDSLSITHWMMTNYPNCEVFHCNTGVGIERTREFVRQTCKDFGWPLTEIRAKEDCGQDYEEFVKRWGFPGPGGHGLMYSRLKERAINKLVRDNKTAWKDRILIATGIRHDESKRRMRYVGNEINRTGAKLWVNPIYWWSGSDRDKYIKENNLPINPVSQELGMSGECLCGAFAHKGEKELVRIVCPETAEYLDKLEKEVMSLGFDWGWEGAPNPKKKENGIVSKTRQNKIDVWDKISEQGVWDRLDDYRIVAHNKGYIALNPNKQALRGPTGRLRSWKTPEKAMEAVDRTSPYEQQRIFCVGCEKEE